MNLFLLRTFRIAVSGSFVTRLGIGGVPFLLPLLYQVGLGLPAWKSGLLMMPAALGAMGMKMASAHILKRCGYRQVLVFNTLLIGATIAMFATVGPRTPLAVIVAIGLAQGLFNSLQFSSMNSLAYADVEAGDSSMASTISSSFQQLSMSFGLATGTLVTGWFLGRVPQTDRVLVTHAIHHAFLFLAAMTAISSASFWRLQRTDGHSISHGAPPPPSVEPVTVTQSD
jgi:Na+/melibiose symporter-like transporter